MRRTCIGHSNLIDSATLYGLGWSPTYPLTKLQDSELAEYAQTTGTTATFDADHGSAVAAQVFCLFAHNVSDASATIQVTRGATQGDDSEFDSGALDCWAFAPLGGDRDGGHFGLFVIAPADSTARWTRFVVTGSATMRFGRAFIGGLFVPEHNPQSGHTEDGWQGPNSSITRTENGADWRAQRKELRSAAFDYSALTPAQGSLLHEIMRTHSVTGEMVYVRDTEDRAAQQQYGFLATARKLSALENPFYGYKSAAIALDERGGAP